MIVRGDGVGDALVLAPLVAALRDAGHEVGALLSTRNAGAFVAGTFARVHVVERIPWPRHGSTPQSYLRALTQARAADYDVALVASEEPEAYRFARDAAIPRRVGFVNGWEKPLKTARSRSLLTEALARSASASRAREHEVETLFRLGAGLHSESGPTRDLGRLRPLIAAPSAPVDARDDAPLAVQCSQKFVAALGVDGFLAFVGALRVPGERVVVASDAEAEALAPAARERGITVASFARVRDWIERLAQMRAVVTVDGGAAHVAGMSGVPCVDLFAPAPSVGYDMRRWAPWAAPHRRLLLCASPPLDAAATSDALAALGVA